MKHTHKYKRITFKTGHSIFRCMLPECPHFIRSELAINRKSLCWRCNEPFIMRRINLVKPHCDKCSKKDIVVSKAIDTLLSTIGGS